MGTRGRFYSLLVLRVGYSYDIHNNLTGLTQTVNGVERISSYTYDDDNRVTSVTADGSTTYSYAYAANAGGRRGQFYYPHQQKLNNPMRGRASGPFFIFPAKKYRSKIFLEISKIFVTKCLSKSFKYMKGFSSKKDKAPRLQ